MKSFIAAGSIDGEQRRPRLYDEIDPALSQDVVPFTYNFHDVNLNVKLMTVLSENIHVVVYC